MRLTSITIKRFRNFAPAQTISAEEDVTCLVGKNESGKTTILKALHRLNPANGADKKFHVSTEYPRWLLSADRRTEDLEKVAPIAATFMLTEADIEALAVVLPARPPIGSVCNAYRNYSNALCVWLSCDIKEVLAQAASDADVSKEDAAEITTAGTADQAVSIASERGKTHREAGEQAQAKALGAFSKHFASYDYLVKPTALEEPAQKAVIDLLPKFFYFSSYQELPGECDLTLLAGKVVAGTALTDQERTVIALLERAGQQPEDFLDDDYDSRKAELQAASLDLSTDVFKYWKQNTDLTVVFDTDMVSVPNPAPTGGSAYHRFLKIELRDDRHGGVETNFSTRSAGFQWFFSFFAAFTEYQHSDKSVVVLLDEPGTSLHGEAQGDFVRYIFHELGASKQVIYTTHSQHMVDPAKYEKIRAVHDRATRADKHLAVEVTRVDLSVDRDTVLPVEAALGYSISQHLFLGSGHHLLVEGSSDFVFLQRMTEHLVASGRTGLDPRLSIIPVGGADNMPAFVALLGRRLGVSALIDGDRSPKKKERVLAAARHSGKVPESAVVVCSDVDGVPGTGDIEDLFHEEDYVRLYSWSVAPFSSAELPATAEPILRRLEVAMGEKFDHVLPAHALTERRTEFFASVNAVTLDRFEQLFQLLNATVTSRST